MGFGGDVGGFRWVEQERADGGEAVDGLRVSSLPVDSEIVLVGQGKIRRGKSVVGWRRDVGKRKIGAFLLLRRPFVEDVSFEARDRSKDGEKCRYPKTKRPNDSPILEIVVERYRVPTRRANLKNLDEDDGSRTWHPKA